MRWLLPLLLLSCSTATPGYFGAPGTPVEVDGFSFTVRQIGQRAEVVRTGPTLRLRAVAPAAHRAAGMVTGCRTIPGTIRGDPAVYVFDLNCARPDAPLGIYPVDE